MLWIYPSFNSSLRKGHLFTEDAERVLQSAVTAQDLALIRMLLEKETALSEEDTERMMQYTVETLHRDELEFWRNLEIISILIKRGAPLSEENAQTVLAYAIERQDLEVINNLLMRGITPLQKPPRDPVFIDRTTIHTSAPVFIWKTAIRLRNNYATYTRLCNNSRSLLSQLEGPPS